MSNYEEKIANNPPSLINEVNYIENSSLSYFVNQKSALNGMYLDIGSKYFGNEDILSSNSIGMKHYSNLCGNCEDEVWLVLPLNFPIATLHSVTNQRNSLYCESSGGSLCFSPEETNISRLFSTIQGLSDVGAGFFQIVIAKINGVAADNIEAIKKEFERTFNDEDLLTSGFVPLKPIGWRKRSLSKVSSTIPIEESSNAVISSMINKTNSFYNAILVSKNYTETCKGTIAKLGMLSKVFLDKIKFMYPSLDIVKVSDLEKDHFFEVTIRMTQMPSYVSSEGEDFDSKDKKLSMFRSSQELNNMTPIYLGDIRLINPYKTEVDARIPCGLFKTFSLISSHSIIEKSGCYMATYIPFSHERKKKYSKVSYNENGAENTITNSTQINSSQILDKIQYKVSTPKILTFGDKETSIKTPPPSNFLSNSSNCVSNISTCDMGYNTVFNSNLCRKSYSCTPTTKASLSKISYTPFSSTEIDSSPWIGVDFHIESASIFSFEQETQQIIPPRISSLNHMSNSSNNKSNNYVGSQLFQSNFFSEGPFSNDIIKHIDYNHLEVGNIPSDNYEISFVKEANKFGKNEIRESMFETENNSEKNQTVDFDCCNKLIEFECPPFLENKDFDILNMLENIFSDNSVTNVENCRVGCSEYFNNIGTANNNDKLLEEKANKTLDKKYNEDFDLWSFELYSNSNSYSGKQNSSVHKKDKTSEFVPSELNYLNEQILFGKQLILDP